jgi:geranylgeranyl diphosphate synthase type II
VTVVDRSAVETPLPIRVPSDLLAYYDRLLGLEVQRTLATDAPTRLDALVGTYPGRRGKGLRPAMLLATCEAFGGDVRDALPAAVALELMHNAFLVHDDVEDDTDRRRGGPTLHREHGVAMAVHAGDALAVQAMAPLLDQPRLSAHLARRVAREFLDTVRRTLDGQTLELAWRQETRVDLGPDDYLQLVLQKSCWYTTIFPVRAGCLIGARASVPLGPLTHFGFLLGSAFQIRDDVLDLDGDPARHGKEAWSDVREGKRTLPLIHLFGTARHEELAWLHRFLALEQDERSDADVAQVVALMREHGSIEVATAWADALAGAARRAFGAAFARSVSPFHARCVEQIIDFVVEREV